MSSVHERKELARIKLETVRDEYGVELPTFSWEVCQTHAHAHAHAHRAFHPLAGSGC
jgi:hypothetical protein